MEQKALDRNQKTYVLSFPQELEEEAVLAWLRSLSGTLIPKHGWMSGTPTIVFEVWATAGRIRHRLKVPWTHADFITAQLHAHIPGIRFDAETEWPKVAAWSEAVEVGLRNTGRPLQIADVEQVSRTLLKTTDGLAKGETVLVQWVVASMPPQALPEHGDAKTDDPLKLMVKGKVLAGRDEVQQRRDKLSEPNFLTVLRVGTVAPTQVRAKHLMENVKKGLKSTRSHKIRWQARIVSKKKLAERIKLAATPTIWGGQLNAAELAALVYWPIGNPFISGLPAPLARRLPVPESVPREGRVIGMSNFYGAERPVAQSFADALMHTHVLGPPGVGKTVLLGNMIKQDMDNGYGAILIESKGDLFRTALNYVPKDRLKDVIVLDVNDVRNPVGFNVLRQGDPAVVVDELVMIFNQLFKDNPSIWMNKIMYHGLHTLAADPDAAFTDLASLVYPDDSEKDWVARLISQTRDPQIKRFWRDFQALPPGRRDQIVSPVLDRVWTMQRSKLLNVVGQSSSSFFMDDVIRNRKILLANFSGIERESATLMGTMILNSAWNSAQRVGEHADGATFMYMDEAHRYMNLPVDLKLMLVEARAKKLGLVIAHQDLSQLPSGIREAVVSNARSKVVFQTSDSDAREMARALGGSLTDRDLSTLGQYEAVARVKTAAGVSPPFTISTLPPDRGYNTAAIVTETSRALYGRDVHAVQQQMLDRKDIKPERMPNAARPPISGFGD